MALEGAVTGWQWVLLAAAAFVVGVSKTSIGGFAVLAVAAFASVLPAKESTAAVLLLLIVGDLAGVARFHRAADWGLLRRLLPGVLPGVALGALFLYAVDDQLLRRTIGVLILGMLLVQLWLRRLGPSLAASTGEAGSTGTASAGPARSRAEHPVTAVTAGVAAGFTTMTANAAGAVTTLYLLAMRVDKLRFLGTNAWFYLLVNVGKTPFSAALGLFPASTLQLTATLAPAVLVGAFVGVRVVGQVSQVSFERLALASSGVAGLALLVR